jgi:hypothetical protein
VPAAPALYPALKRSEQALLLGVAVGVFLFVGGPIWRRFADWNAAIFWSYALIPALVLGALVLKRRLGWRPFALHTLELAAVKFVITATVLLVVMMARGPGAARPLPAQGLDAVRAAALALPDAVPLTVAPDPAGGEVRGTLRGADAGTVEGWAWLEGVTAARVAGPALPVVTVIERGEGFEPSFTLLEVGQPLQVHSADRRLHTAQMRAENETLFNVPIPAEGNSPARTLLEPVEAELRCTVHGAERAGRVLVLDHPFFARSDEAGEFRIAHVPPGHYELVVAAPDGTQRRREGVEVPGGGAVEVQALLGGGNGR